MKNKKSRIGIFILVLLAVLIGIAFIFRKKILEHYMPVVKQYGVLTVKIKNDTSFISSKITVQNKAFIKINVDTLKYTVALFDKTYMQDQRFIGVELPAYGTDTFDFSLKIPYVRLMKEIKSQGKKADSAYYAINAWLQFSSAFWDGEIPFSRAAKFRIPHPPEIEIVKINYKRIQMRSIVAEARIRVINDNPINISIKNVSYNFKVPNQGNLEGEYKKSIDIKPFGTTYITLPFEINIKNMGKVIFKILMNTDNYDYTLTLKATLEAKDPIKESFYIDLTKDGKMELKK